MTRAVANCEYDNVNRLIREDSAEEQVTRTWAYDRIGHIVLKYEYDYAPDTATVNLGTPAKTYVYGYNPEGWEDKLISCTVTEDDTTTTLKSYTYDQVGNTLTDGTWSYEWEPGRQLKSMAKTGETSTPPTVCGPRKPMAPTPTVTSTTPVSSSG